MVIGDYRHVVGVVAHESRGQAGWNLRRATDAEFVSVDCGLLGSGRNHLGVLKALLAEAERHPDVEWVVVLEDDALPAVGFVREEMSAALDNCPSLVASFYLGTGYPAQFQRRFAEAVQSPEPWIVHHQLRHAVAYAVNVDILRPLIAHTAPLLNDCWAADDAVTNWAQRHGVKVSYSNPSLFDHDDSMPSVITQRTHLGKPTGGRSRPRRAMRLGAPGHWSTLHVTV